VILAVLGGILSIEAADEAVSRAPPDSRGREYLNRFCEGSRGK
jgi:hypothetical protein